MSRAFGILIAKGSGSRDRRPIIEGRLVRSVFRSSQRDRYRDRTVKPRDQFAGLPVAFLLDLIVHFSEETTKGCPEHLLLTDAAAHNPCHQRSECAPSAETTMPSLHV